MTERREAFTVGKNPRLELQLVTGDVRILSGPSGEVAAEVRGRQAATVTFDQVGETVTIRQERGRWAAGSLEITIHVPPGSSLDASVVSADLTIEVVVSDLEVKGASGDVRARRVHRDAAVKSASGDIEISEVGGRLRLASTSGRVKVGVIAGDAICSTASGDLVIGFAGRDLTAKSASGDITVEEYGGADLRGRTVSGDMRVGLTSGQRVAVDLQSLSGNLHLPSSPGREGAKPPVRISFKSVSGDFELISRQPSAGGHQSLV